MLNFKADAARQTPELNATRESAAEYAASVGGQTFETSSKTGEQVEELFTAIAESFFDSSPGGGAALTRGNPVQVSAQPQEKKGGCCG
jgi:GTPase SAR1 family protein